MAPTLPEIRTEPVDCPASRPIAAIIAALATVSTVAGLVTLIVMTALG
jgi:hypothetical protein